MSCCSICVELGAHSLLNQESKWERVSLGREEKKGRERGERTSGYGGGLFHENLLFNSKNTPPTPPVFVYVLGYVLKSLLSQLEYFVPTKIALSHKHMHVHTHLHINSFFEHMTKSINNQSDGGLIQSLSVYKQTRVWFWLNPDPMWI